MAAIATFALKADVWFRRGLLLMLSPDSRAKSCPLSGRSSTYRPVQIPEAGSLLHLTFPKVMSAFSAMVFLCRLWKYRRYNQIPAVGPVCQQFFGQKALCLANDSRSQCRAIAVALKF